MTRNEADRIAAAAHNAKALIKGALAVLAVSFDPSDIDHQKCRKDINYAMEMLTSIEYDMDKIPASPALKKKAEVTA